MKKLSLFFVCCSLIFAVTVKATPEEDFDKASSITTTNTEQQTDESFQIYRGLQQSIKKRDHKTVRSILNECDEVRLGSLQGITLDGRTLVHQAAQEGAYEPLLVLEQLGFNLDQKSENTGATMLHFATAAPAHKDQEPQKGHLFSEFDGYPKLGPSQPLEIVKYLINEKKHDPCALDNAGNSVIDCAVISDNDKIVNFLLDCKYTDVNVPNKKGETLLQLACRLQSIQVFKTLLQREGVNVNDKNKQGETVLYTACRYKNTDMIKLSLAHKYTDVNMPNNEGETPLQLACRLGHKQVVEHLLNHTDIDINAQTNQGETPLQAACHREHTDVIKLLLGHPACNVHALNTHEQNALHALLIGDF